MARSSVAEGNGIPACPSAWYLVESSVRLKARGIVATTVGDHEIVVFRDTCGEAHALAAHCVHMGCHLKSGQVIGDRIRCALHFRQFDGAGLCRALPGGKTEDSAVQPRYPIVERFGGIFVFVGNTMPFAFPSPHEQPDQFFTTRAVGPVELSVPWYAAVANGCDLDHLRTVHLRKLKEPPRVEHLPPHGFRIQYRTKIIGNRAADSVIRRLSGDDIQATITCLGGALMLVESTIRGRRTFLLLSMRAKDAITSVRGLVGFPRGRSRLVDAASLRVTTWLFLSFLRRDMSVLDEQRLRRPSTIATDGDRYMSLLFDYFESLGRSALNVVEREVVNQ